MIAGVGKSYRMLQEAHELLENGVDVQIGYIETHGRAGTAALMQGLPVIPRRKIFYKGKELEEMDVDAIIRLHPEIVIVDELADVYKRQECWSILIIPMAMVLALGFYTRRKKLAYSIFGVML